jgi:HPt (histidine-containing phosphotransfer) domain-containing protein
MTIQKPLHGNPAAGPPLLDLDALLDRIGGDGALALALLAAYPGQELTLLRVVDAAGTAGDLPAVAHGAHALAGTLATLGAMPAAARARAVERAARDGNTTSIPVERLALGAALGDLRQAVDEARTLAGGTQAGKVRP